MMAETGSENIPVNGGSIKTEKVEVKKEEDQPLSDLDINIIEQIEYYFGDYNLPKDKFLQEEIKKDDGWILLSTMLKFKRLAKISDQSDVIVAALKKSQSGLMEVSEDKTKIRRCPTQVLPEFNEARRQELMARSLYVKGFPMENTEMDELLDFFKKHTKIDQLIMRKYLDKATKKYVFKGSVFAVLPSAEDVENFLKLPPLNYQDIELIVKSQNAYSAEKRNDREQTRLENKKRKTEHRKRKGDNEGDEEEERDNKKEELPKGASLHMSDCSEELTREELKSKIEDFGITVGFVYFCKGDKEGWIRLQEPNSANELIKDLKDGKLEVKENVVVTLKVLEGEDETKFIERCVDDMAKRKHQNKRFKGRKGKRGGFHATYGRKRRGSPNAYDDVSAKKKAARADV